MPQHALRHVEPETWKPVVGLESFYEISDLGRVRVATRSLGRYHQGDLVQISKTHGFGTWTARNALCAPGMPDKRQRRMVHIEVLKAFRGRPRYGQWARHVSGDKSDNRLVNLEWSWKPPKGFERLQGENHPRSKLTTEKVLQIYADPRAAKEIAREMGIHSSTVGHIKNGSRWASVTQAASKP